jgi:hypothetical protein
LVSLIGLPSFKNPVRISGPCGNKRQIQNTSYNDIKAHIKKNKVRTETTYHGMTK